MHEKRFKIDFFVNFRKFQKKLHICKKKYAEIFNVARAIVTIVEKKVKRVERIFFGSHLEEQSVVFISPRKTNPNRPGLPPLATASFMISKKQDKNNISNGLAQKLFLTSKNCLKLRWTRKLVIVSEMTLRLPKGTVLTPPLYLRPQTWK